MKAFKKSKFREYDEEDENHFNARREAKRRPIKNWTKVWVDHSDEAEEIDEFYTHR